MGDVNVAVDVVDMTTKLEVYRTRPATASQDNPSGAAEGGLGIPRHNGPYLHVTNGLDPAKAKIRVRIISVALDRTSPIVVHLTGQPKVCSS